MARRIGRAKTKHRVGAVQRCLQVFEILAGEPYVLSLAEISSSLSLAKSSTHRLMNLLVDSGFVEQEPATRRYALTPKVLWIGSSYLRNSAVERSAHALLSQLSDETGTTSHLAVWDSGTALLLHSTDPSSATSLFVEVGERRPVHATALGKALLAYRPSVELKRICQGGLAQFTPRTMTSQSVIEADCSVSGKPVLPWMMRNSRGGSAASRRRSGTGMESSRPWASVAISAASRTKRFLA